MSSEKLITKCLHFSGSFLITANKTLQFFFFFSFFPETFIWFPCHRLIIIILKFQINNKPETFQDGKNNLHSCKIQGDNDYDWLRRNNVCKTLRFKKNQFKKVRSNTFRNK